MGMSKSKDGHGIALDSDLHCNIYMKYSIQPNKDKINNISTTYLI
jgi:hypothetical protein